MTKNEKKFAAIRRRKFDREKAGREKMPHQAKISDLVSLIGLNEVLVLLACVCNDRDDDLRPYQESEDYVWHQAADAIYLAVDNLPEVLRS